ncbi:hypothetical protein BgiBS90_015176, partial [Biomphalaria glabrata]
IDVTDIENRSSPISQCDQVVFLRFIIESIILKLAVTFLFAWFSVSSVIRQDGWFLLRSLRILEMKKI